MKKDMHQRMFQGYDADKESYLRYLRHIKVENSPHESIGFAII